MSDFEKFKEELRSKDKFYSSLSNKIITAKEYEHALKIFKKTEAKTMKGHLDLYLKYDVLLLADVFENIRNNR